MKTKRIVIKSREEMRRESLAFVKKLDRGEKVSPVRGQYFESIEAVRRFLTDARLELWRTVRDRKPISLADQLRFEVA